MPSKTTKKARRAGTKQSNLPVEKDDGTRWVVINLKGEQVYLGQGVTKREAERLATGLQAASGIRQV